MIIIEVNTSADAINAVLDNRADILFDTNGTLVYTLEMESITSIIPFRTSRHSIENPIHIVVNKANPTLASIIQKGLDLPTRPRNMQGGLIRSQMNLNILLIKTLPNVNYISDIGHGNHLFVFFGGSHPSNQVIELVN